MSRPASAAPLRIAAFLAFVGVALGAFGAHALKDQLAAGGRVETWHTAVFYHLLHGVALFALAVSGRRHAVTFWSWLTGVILFSGSLYGLCLLEKARWLGPVTPLGGLAMLIGWLALIIRPPRA
jgi:uncharacterized membrane protein YgdD (TMEM256/DUF423 family)